MPTSGLYGQQKPPKPIQSGPQPSSTLAFTTQLSSLISQGVTSSSSATRGRSRPSKAAKSDIFTRHNKGSQKRAAADVAEDELYARQVHQRMEDIGTVDAATLHRSKKRMEEKSRIYDDLQNGMYLMEDSDSDSAKEKAHKSAGSSYLARLRRKEKEGLVDFDRKWADAERMDESRDADAEPEPGNKNDKDKDNDGDDGGGGDDNESVVSYEDELGRTRHGTRNEAARASRIRLQGATSIDSERWRPARPDNLIHGPAIQSHAFNPAAETASQVKYLASRRDRSPTPPEETHYDADHEVRTRGTGFYAFSKDEEVRKRQMEELMHVREETQREREERLERRALRERVKEERKKKIEELRTKRRADTFLAGLGDLVGAEGTV